MEKAAELLGFGAAFVYAGATFSLFMWLDTEASDAAKTAITGWLRPLSYDRAAVAAAIVEIFDRIYSKPLLSWRGFVRSAVITTVITSVFVIDDAMTEGVGTIPKIIFAWSVLAALLANILSDYVSLFVVRRWLLIKWKFLVLALITGAIVGGLVVSCIVYVRLTTFLTMAAWLADDVSDYRAAEDMIQIEGIIQAYEFMARYSQFVYAQAALTTVSIFAPLVVHLWLVLFALGVVGVRLSKYVVTSVTFARWFIKEGDNRPLRAIGYVAAFLVFIISGTISILGRTLS